MKVCLIKVWSVSWTQNSTKGLGPSCCEFANVDEGTYKESLTACSSEVCNKISSLRTETGDYCSTFRCRVWYNLSCSTGDIWLSHLTIIRHHVMCKVYAWLALEDEHRSNDRPSSDSIFLDFVLDLYVGIKKETVKNLYWNNRSSLRYPTLVI